MSKAFGEPGKVDTWEHADKEAIGAAYHSGNRIWFTLWRGALTEVMYPTVDSAQVRDMQFVVSDGNSYVFCEDTDFDSEVARLGDNSQAYRFTAVSRDGGYRYEKDVICNPEAPCVLQHYRLSKHNARGVAAYFVCNPHLRDREGGAGAKVTRLEGRRVLLAHNGDRWLAMTADCGFSKASVGYAGTSDGLTDLRDNFRMDYEFDEAKAPGNVVLTGQIPDGVGDFTIGLALGDTPHAALFHLATSLALKFEDLCNEYLDQWRKAGEGAIDFSSTTGDGGRLYHISRNTIYTHEDRKYQGALIASLATPFGQAKKALTPSHAGYHLVWPRDAVHSATALLATGDRDTPLRTLIYLAVSQRENGSFAQNFWIDGEPNMSSLQLDEVCLPILLARQLRRESALVNFNPLPMVYKAAEYMIDRGPITPEERWEQRSGYSPSTLAVAISAMICAAALAREDGKPIAAAFLEDYADWLRDHLEEWTVTTRGEAVPDIHRYFIRINPAEPGDADAPTPDEAILKMSDQPPGQPTHYPARNVVDTGFLELVRFGVMRPDDPVILDSVQVIDRVLKVDTPFGPSWHRYTHDGYGQKPDGSPYKEWGIGRAWPLLTGERGLYELRAGNDPKLYITTMERLSGRTGLLDEQVWDRPFYLDGKDLFGCSTGSARPLVWAHSEYLKLVRSAADGEVYDLIPEVDQRYRDAGRRKGLLNFWAKTYPIPAIHASETLRVFAHKPFRLRYTLDNWANSREADSTATELHIEYADLTTGAGQKAPVRFSFFWTDDRRWDACDYAVAVK